jgi:hypothetical protein
VNMRERSTALVSTFFIVGVPSLLYASMPGHRHLMVLFIVWPVLFTLLSVVFLRCPHCGKYAGRTPVGLYTLPLSDQCRYCNKSY